MVTRWCLVCLRRLKTGKTVLFEGAGIFNFISPQEALRLCKEMRVFFVMKGAVSIAMVTNYPILLCDSTQTFMV